MIGLKDYNLRLTSSSEASLNITTCTVTNVDYNKFITCLERSSLAPDATPDAASPAPESALASGSAAAQAKAKRPKMTTTL